MIKESVYRHRYKENQGKLPCCRWSAGCSRPVRPLQRLGWDSVERWLAGSRLPGLCSSVLRPGGGLAGAAALARPAATGPIPDQLLETERDIIPWQPGCITPRGAGRVDTVSHGSVPTTGSALSANRPTYLPAGFLSYLVPTYLLPFL